MYVVCILYVCIIIYVVTVHKASDLQWEADCVRSVRCVFIIIVTLTTSQSVFSLLLNIFLKNCVVFYFKAGVYIINSVAFYRT